MRYRTLPAAHYHNNRRKLAKHLVPGGAVIVQSNDILPTHADGTLPLYQNADLFYLTGIDQEETILILFPDSYDGKHREILFVRETNDHIKVWEGYKLTKEQATERSGIKTVYWTHEFERVWHAVMGEAKAVYLNTNEHTRAVVEVETREMRFAHLCRTKYPVHTYLRLAPLMHQIRISKDSHEVGAIKQACDITEAGFRRLLGFVKPGVMEYEVEAEMLHEYVRRGSRGFAYTPIVASGANACILHYNDNYRVCNDGDLLLLDCAAEYGNYYSDLTRCIPVNGKFSIRQREVYEAVLRVYKAAAQMLRVGNSLPDYEFVVGKMMEQELVGLGLLMADDLKRQDPSKPLYKRYYPHGTSHHIGLDVHDVGHRYTTFVPGMVFTVEPGIYIPEEGIGIRIENNFVITDGAPIDLMAGIPIEVDEIEALMAQRT